MGKEKGKRKGSKKTLESVDKWKDKDPVPLIKELQKLQVLDIEGKMTPVLRIRKNALMEKFHKIRAAKVASGQEAPEIPNLDYESLKKQIVRDSRARKQGQVLEGDNVLDAYDEGELPDLPLGIAPPHELIAHLILHQKFPGETFAVSQTLPELKIEEKPSVPIIPSASFVHPSENVNLMTMLEVKGRAHEIEQKALQTMKRDKPDFNPLVADYGDDEEEEEEEVGKLNALENAPQHAVTSAEPVMRNLQKELVHLVPSALLRKKSTAKNQ